MRISFNKDVRLGKAYVTYLRCLDVFSLLVTHAQTNQKYEVNFSLAKQNHQHSYVVVYYTATHSVKANTLVL